MDTGFRRQIFKSGNSALLSSISPKNARDRRQQQPSLLSQQLIAVTTSIKQKLASKSDYLAFQGGQPTWQRSCVRVNQRVCVLRGGGNVTSCVCARFMRQFARKSACISSNVACVPVEMEHMCALFRVSVDLNPLRLP